MMTSQLYIIVLIFFHGTLVQSESSLECGERTILSLNRDDLDDLLVGNDEEVVISPMRLDSSDGVPPECVRPSGNVAVFNISLLDCSPTVTQDEYVINVTYIVRNQPKKNLSSPIQRFKDRFIRLTCSFMANENLTSVPIVPAVSVVELTPASVESVLDLALCFFTSDSFDVEIENVMVTVPDPVFVAVKFEESSPSNDDINVQIMDCYASTMSQPNSEPRYNLIDDGCKANDRVMIKKNFDGPRAEFTFMSFTWTQNPALNIFLHCEISLCFNTTDQICETKTCPNSGKKRRSAMEHHQLIVSKKITVFQTTKETCQTNNGGCSDDCVMVDDDVMCSCSSGRLLANDMKSCYDPTLLKVIQYKADWMMDWIIILGALVLMGILFLFYLIRCGRNENVKVVRDY